MVAVASVAQAAPIRPQSAEELYERGLRQMRTGNYTRALESFNQVRNYHRDDPVSVQAQLAIAELHFKKRDFEQARFAYEEFAALHPRHKDIDLVVFRTGLAIFKRASVFAGRDQSATRAAVNTWTGFDSRFPESKHSAEVNRHLKKARDRLAAKELSVARFYARKQAWGAVRNRSEYLLKRYPNSVSAVEAMSLRGQALYQWGQVDEASQVRAELAEMAPDSRELTQLDRTMAGPPGEQPDEKVFVRPYRIRAPQSPGAGQGQPAR